MDNGFVILKWGKWVLGVLLAVIMYLGCFETNEYLDYQVKQAAFSGTMTSRSEAGMYWKGFGSIFTYPKSEDIDFKSYNMEVRFNDGSVAKVVGTVKFRMPTSKEKQIALHRDFGSYENVASDLIVKNVKEVLSQTATTMSAEESYSTRRGEFASIAEQQAKAGIFETKSNEVDALDIASGTKFKKRIIEIAYDKDGIPIVRKQSLLKEYDIEILQFVVNDFEYDAKINELISRKKEAEQEKVVAAANAEKAKQEAETIKQQGIAKVATAEADALALKKTAVVESEKKAEVAKQEAIQAEYEAKAILSKGRADAEASRLKVIAGLSPLERATIAKETQIEVAKALSNVKFPNTMIVVGGGNGNGSKVDPFTAVGLQSLYELSGKISNESK